MPKRPTKSRRPRAAAMSDDDKRLQAMWAILQRAHQGDQTVSKDLLVLLEEQPLVWNHYGAIAEIIERLWINWMARRDLVIVESMRKQLRVMRESLAPTEADPLVRLQGSQVVMTWLRVKVAEMELSQSRDQPLRVRQMSMRQLEGAEHQFHSACRQLATTRRLLRGIELHLKVEHTHPASVDPMTPPPRPATGPSRDDLARVRDRVKRMFGRSVGQAMAIA
jgi:hypothetical protein